MRLPSAQSCPVGMEVGGGRHLGMAEHLSFTDCLQAPRGPALGSPCASADSSTNYPSDLASLALSLVLPLATHTHGHAYTHLLVLGPATDPGPPLRVRPTLYYSICIVHPHVTSPFRRTSPSVLRHAVTDTLFPISLFYC